MSEPANTLVVIGDVGPDLVPSEIGEDLLGTAASRVGEAHAYLVTPYEEPFVRQVLARLEQRWAVGASEIWELFPELRDEFVCEVERASFDGPRTLSRRFDQIVPGDRLLSHRVTFEPALMMPGKPLPETARTTREAHELKLAAPFLDAPTTTERLSLRQSLVFLCDDFALERRGQTHLGAGLHFLTPTELLETTDFMPIWAEQAAVRAQIGSRPVLLPTNFTGAFVIEVAGAAEPAYAQALVARLIAAAALTTPTRARGLFEITFRSNGFYLRHLWREQWMLPEPGRRDRERQTVTLVDSAFWRAAEIVLRDTPDQFAKAKDDFRSLALETFGDARHSSVLALQYVQTWMAIERLLTFKTETTAQLATVLCALHPGPDRPAAFDHYKTRYDLRSRIAHGYDFARDQDMYAAVREVVAIFQRVFRLALESLSAKALRQRLLDHVLRGSFRAIDDGDDATDTGDSQVAEDAP